MTLPEGWRALPLAPIASVSLGQSPPSSAYNDEGKGLPFFQGKADFTDTYAQVRKYSTEGSKRARAEDILLSVRAPVGPTNLAPADCVIGRGLAAIRANPTIVEQRYLLWALRATEHRLAKEAAGSTFVAVTGSQVRSHVLPVAPLPEQQRIVAIVEEHLTDVESSTKTIHSAELRIRTLERAWLRGALAGLSGPTRQIGTVLHEARGGWSRSARHLVPAAVGVPYLKMNNISRDGSLDLDELVYVSPEAGSVEKYGVRPGDILFNSKNSAELVGKTALADARVSGALLNENIMRLRFDSIMDPAFVWLWFQGHIMKDLIGEASRASTNVAAVYQHRLVEMPILVPQIQDQRAVASAFAEIRAAGDRARRACVAVRERAGALERAILAAAFAGRLTGRSSDTAVIEDIAGRESA